MVFIKVKNGGILHRVNEYNGKKFKLGLDSMFLNSNLIYIETDCKIKIDERVIHLKKGKYTISNLNKLIEPVCLSYDNKKIQIKSPCYYSLDENLKQYLGFPNTTFDFMFVGNKSLYFPTSDEKYINIEEDCEFTLYTDDKNSNINHKIPMGIYSLDELDLILNADQNEHFIDIEIDNENKLKITSVYNFEFDKNLKKYLGYSWMKSGTEKINIYTQGFFKNLNGVIFTRSKGIEIESNQINNTEFSEIKTTINGNYSINQLISLLPSSIKLQFDNNFISLRSKNYFSLDENLKSSLGFNNDNNYLYKNVGEKEISNNHINKQLLEVHCNIIEKSNSSNNEMAIQEELLYVFYYDPNNLFIKVNSIMYRQVLRNNQFIEIYFIDQNGNKVDFGDFIVYLDLIEEKTN